MRLGILTGGGDCPGLNAVIRAAVVRTIRTYESQIVGFQDGWVGLLEGKTMELTVESIRGILPRGGTMLGTSRVDPVKRPGGIDAVRDAVRLFRLDGLLVCGGDGTLNAAATVSEAGVPVIGIPKTIDNDIPGTDYSFGFDTALGTVVHAIDQLHSTAESHDRVIVVEAMGRSVGWIAVCASLAGGADVVVTPERPMSVAEVCDTVRLRRARGRSFSIVVVAEGATFAPEADGRVLEVPTRTDEFGRPRYGGVGSVLALAIEQRTGIETRTVTLGYVQRGGTPSAFDRLLGTRMGVHAVDLASRGEYGLLVSLQGTRIASVPLSVVRGGPRPVDPDFLETARVFSG
jgi:phosphofructokinase-like protein